MMQMGQFEIGKVEFNISSKLAKTEITLSLIIQGDENPRLYPLSGFPRRFANEEPTGSEYINPLGGDRYCLKPFAYGSAESRFAHRRMTLTPEPNEKSPGTSALSSIVFDSSSLSS
jgi:hypothetical protein